jgi:hypothetical protein
MNRGNLVYVSQVVRDGDLPLFHGFPDKPAERRSAVSPADRAPLIVATIVYVSTIVFIASIVVILIAVVGVVPISVIIAVVSVASCTPFTGLLGQGFSDGYS